MTEPTLHDILKAGATNPKLATEAFQKALDEYDANERQAAAYADYERALSALKPRAPNSNDPRVLELRKRFSVGGA